MRLFDYMYEGIVEKSLKIDEPEVGNKYSNEYVNKIVRQLKTALAQSKKGSYVDDDARNAIVSDLEDKIEKWENVEQETQPAKPEGGGEEDLEDTSDEIDSDEDGEIEDEDLDAVDDELEDEEDLEESKKPILVRKINSRIRRIKK